MWSAIPIVGWILGPLFAMSMAIPFWLLWTCCGIGQKFFDFLPAKYLDLGFWQVVGLFLTISILKAILLPSFGTTVTNNKEK